MPHSSSHQPSALQKSLLVLDPRKATKLREQPKKQDKSQPCSPSPESTSHTRAQRPEKCTGGPAGLTSECVCVPACAGTCVCVPVYVDSIPVCAGNVCSFMCGCWCIPVCAGSCVFLYVQVTCIPLCVAIGAFLCVQVHVSLYVWVHVYIPVCAGICVFLYVWVHMCVFLYVRIHV